MGTRSHWCRQTLEKMAAIKKKKPVSFLNLGFLKQIKFPKPLLQKDDNLNNYVKLLFMFLRKF